MLIMGLLRNPVPESDGVFNRIESAFGPIHARTPEIPFAFTSYYTPEMGEGLLRSYMSFECLVCPDVLAAAKLASNAIESAFSRDGRRLVNLDPGLLTPHNLILASCKDFSHRIYLRDGVYGEVTLIFTKGRFTVLPWTYPDYASEEVSTFFLSQREDYLVMRRADVSVNSRSLPSK